MERIRVASLQYLIRPVQTFEQFRDEVTVLVVKQIVTGPLRDLALSFQLKFVPLAVAPDYLHHDPESPGFAAVIEWLNSDVATPQNYSSQQNRFRTEFP